MIENYLQKLQELQRDSFDTYVNVEISCHYDTDKNYPWISATVTLAGYHTKMMKPVPDEFKFLNVQFFPYETETEEQTKERLDAEYARFEEFVKTKIEAYK